MHLWGRGNGCNFSPLILIVALAMALNYLGQTITLPALQSFASYCKVLFLNVDMVSMKDSRAGQILEGLYLILNDESNMAIHFPVLLIRIQFFSWVWWWWIDHRWGLSSSLPSSLTEPIMGCLFFVVNHFRALQHLRQLDDVERSIKFVD